jgi:hypothetical protein
MFNLNNYPIKAPINFSEGSKILGDLTTLPNLVLYNVPRLDPSLESSPEELNSLLEDVGSLLSTCDCPCISGAVD